MTNKVLLALIAVITVFLAMNVFGHTERWAYAIVSPTDEDLGSKLQQMGLEGYELIAARRASDGDTHNPTFRYEMIFKRHLEFFRGGEC
jgi:hypothetical protein